MQTDFDVQIEVEDNGTVNIASIDSEAADNVIGEIRSLTEEPEVGKIYTGRATNVTNYGAFVEILPGQEGLLHISELADGYVKKVEDVINVGDEVTVKVIGIDHLGRINLSRRAVFDNQYQAGAAGAKDSPSPDYPFRSAGAAHTPREGGFQQRRSGGRERPFRR